MTDTVLVTGASSGIGEALCHLLVENRYRVVGTARTEERLRPLTEQLGDSFHPLVLDVNDADAVSDIDQSLPDNFKNIYALVNNAGHDVGGRRSFEAGTTEQWCHIIETNVQGVIRMTRAFIEPMLIRQSGHIINIGSIAGIKAYATMAAYTASKYAVHGLSETLRLDYAGKGIRVTEIMPGLVRTGFAEQRLGDAEKAAEFYDNSDASLNPHDVAETVLFALQQPKHVEIAQLVVLPVS